QQAAVFQLDRLVAVRDRRARGTRVHEHHLDTLLDRLSERLETALTEQLDRRIERERRRDRTDSALSEMQACSYTAGRGMEQPGEPRQTRELELSIKLALPPAERLEIAQTVPGTQRAGHRARII